MSNQTLNDNKNPSKIKRGEMISISSAKGGVGKTMLAVNLAVALSKRNKKICILDADFQFGDVSLAMDIQATFSIKDIIEGIDRIDLDALISSLNLHDSGVHVLSAPDRPEYADLVTTSVLEKILDLLLGYFDYVIVDTEVGLQEKSLFLIDKTDTLLIVTNLEMTTLKNTKLMIETLDVLGFRDKVQVIVNRSDMESVIQATDVPGILNETSPIYIPNDFQTTSQSINIGVPFVSNRARTDIAKAIYKMAEQVTSRREIAVFEPPKPSLLQRLLRKTKDKEGQA
ncbi:AAA family ATPase [Desulfuribacillus alkaliarsenatis]|uniref:Histidine kinase n=1 Tax=Desulfuribacillus alkaliarsenatis TaxID=766136 RepID=A0A1E5G040_9FIRM|nr:AAA family ATPase [Desulfuribacillus alkaliarsenatis]OEF96196.1 histidine kinase [Desulfuribacillus alkaliarsenatis]